MPIFFLRSLLQSSKVCFLLTTNRVTTQNFPSSAWFWRVCVRINFSRESPLMCFSEKNTRAILKVQNTPQDLSNFFSCVPASHYLVSFHLLHLLAHIQITHLVLSLLSRQRRSTPLLRSADICGRPTTVGATLGMSTAMTKTRPLQATHHSSKLLIIYWSQVSWALYSRFRMTIISVIFFIISNVISMLMFAV